MTPETPFDIASVSKPISAVVALRLASEGVLELDRPMRQYARQIHPASTLKVVLDVPADTYIVETRCFACPFTRTTHTVLAGRTDTLDFYLGQARRACDTADRTAASSIR